MKKQLSMLALVLSISVLSLGVTGCAKKAPTTAPATPAQQITKVLAVVQRVGIVVEQVQVFEGNMFTAGQVPAAAHATITAAFKKASETVLAAIAALQTTAAATNQRELVQAVSQAIKDISTSLAHLSDKQAAQLAGWLDTAAALIDVSLP